MTDFRDNLRGILAMLACSLFFIINDMFVKMAGETLPLSQIIALRGVVSTLFVAGLAYASGALSAVPALFADRKVWLRTTGEVGATFLYLTALLHMPIANTSAIAQAAPLAITAGGALFLGEKVGWRRWTAVTIGFLGILVIVRPGAADFNAYSLVAFASVLLIALRDVTTRAIPATTPTLAITTFTSVSVMLFGFAMGLGEDWQPVGLVEAGYLLGTGTFLLLGFMTVIVAMRSGDIAVVAPFRYSFIPYAILIGWLVWGDVPDALTLVGIAIVVGTGVYTFYRERRVAARRGRTEAMLPSGVVPAGDAAAVGGEAARVEGERT